MDKKVFEAAMKALMVEDYIKVSRYDVTREELVTYIIAKNGLVGAFLEGDNVYNFQTIGVLNKDAYPKLLKFIQELSYYDDNRKTYISFEYRDYKDRFEYHISDESFERFIISLQDAINAGVNMIEMSEEERAKKLRELAEDNKK